MNEMNESERSRQHDLGDPPVGYSLQSSAVAAGQPEGAVGQQVGAVGDLQDQQIASRGLQQRLQTFLQTATEMSIKSMLFF